MVVRAGSELCVCLRVCLRVCAPVQHFHLWKAKFWGKSKFSL